MRAELRAAQRRLLHLLLPDVRLPRSFYTPKLHAAGPSPPFPLESGRPIVHNVTRVLQRAALRLADVVSVVLRRNSPVSSCRALHFRAQRALHHVVPEAQNKRPKALKISGFRPPAASGRALPWGILSMSTSVPSCGCMGGGRAELRVAQRRRALGFCASVDLQSLRVARGERAQ
ncbi:hypothetical protein DENSPDRAFT_579771 [Dentipellis sp. KUC8613]|nr:hypothetical protein DENSPDRAFT_579771 [Dentipellis sp. KUC8613]